MLMVLLIACGSDPDGIPLSSAIPAKLITPSETTIVTQIVAPTPTIDIPPQNDAAPTPTLGGATKAYQDLQNLITAWINREIPYAEESRLISERTQEPMRLALLGPYNNPLTLIFYNLGQIVIADSQGQEHIVNIAGFEDGLGQRFTFPFHNGTRSEKCKLIRLEVLQGLWVNHHDRISYDELTPQEFIARTDSLSGTTAVATSWLEERGQSRNECDEVEDNYYRQGGDTLSALGNFLSCGECGIEDAPDNLQRFINTIPLVFEPDIPFLRIYKVILISPD